jgi:transposase
VKLEDHLTVEQLATRYRESRYPIERSHVQIVWLLGRGESAKRVAEITGYSARWVSEVARRYSEGGTKALGGRRHQNPGGRFLLDEAHRRELAEALEGPAPDGGLWSGPKVARWIEKASKGRRPLALVHHRYEWLYVYSFVRPSTGRIFWLILPTLSKELYLRALLEFAKAVGAEKKNKRVVLVLDRAGWHPKSGDDSEVTLPEGLHLLPLPSYSPELQPAERLWPLVDEPVANRYFEDLDELEEVLIERCRQLNERPELIRSHTCFHWWDEASS